MCRIDIPRSGLICTTITEELAAKLNLHPMVGENTDHHGTAFTVSVDHKSTSTGISAFEKMQPMTPAVWNKPMIANLAQSMVLLG